jgi:hypothetical protein
MIVDVVGPHAKVVVGISWLPSQATLRYIPGGKRVRMMAGHPTRLVDGSRERNDWPRLLHHDPRKIPGQPTIELKFSSRLIFCSLPAPIP